MVSRTRVTPGAIPSAALACVAILMLAPGLYASAAEMSRAQQQAVLEDALQAFDEGVQSAARNPAQSREAYRQAAGGFESLLRAGLCNASLEYNLANAYFRLNEHGRAILHYRRALLLAPGDPLATENLRYARNRVEPFIEPSASNQLMRRVLFLHYTLAAQTRLRLAFVCLAVGWGALALRLRFSAAPLVPVGLIGVVVGSTLTVSVLWELRTQARTPDAVVIEDRQTLRLGRGEAYDPALSAPLGAGVELQVQQRRGGWVEVELRDGKTGWLPERVIEEI